jgi:biopolymer transport protein ExbD
MAFSPAASNGRNGRRRSGASLGTLAEMNVVPLVDVVLVLLIIFMLTAHVMEFGLEIEAPQVQQVKDSAEDLPVVSITRDGKIYLNETGININQLASEIGRRFKDQKAVYVRGDRRVQYEQVVNIISALSDAHFQVKLVAKPEDLGKKP